MKTKIYLLLGISCLLLYPLNAEAQMAGKVAKAASKILKSTKGKIGVGAITGAAAMEYLDDDEQEQSHFLQKQCPDCMGNCGYYDFY